MRAQGRMADNAGLPVHAGAQQHRFAVRKQLEHLDEIDFDCLRDAFGRLLKQGIKVVRAQRVRSEEHTSELQSLMRISYAVFCLKKKKVRICRAREYIEHPNHNRAL